jgi:hypothetical protein
MSTAETSQPYIDEHAVTIDGGRQSVWRSLVEMPDAMISPTLARILGCVDSEASGPRPLTEGSIVPGFRVVTADEPSELALAGRHHFSDYLLVFRLDELAPDRTRLRAESRAAFPGARGSVYRMLLMGTGGHVLATRRMLTAVKRSAERH